MPQTTLALQSASLHICDFEAAVQNFSLPRHSMLLVMAIKSEGEQVDMMNIAWYFVFLCVCVNVNVLFFFYALRLSLPVEHFAFTLFMTAYVISHIVLDFQQMASFFCELQVFKLVQSPPFRGGTMGV